MTSRTNQYFTTNTYKYKLYNSVLKINVISVQPNLEIILPPINLAAACAPYCVNNLLTFSL